MTTTQRLCLAFVPSALDVCAARLRFQKTQASVVGFKRQIEDAVAKQYYIIIHQVRMFLPLRKVYTVLSSSLYDLS